MLNIYSNDKSLGLISVVGYFFGNLNISHRHLHIVHIFKYVLEIIKHFMRIIYLSSLGFTL